jgi:hypothetical protein
MKMCLPLFLFHQIGLAARFCAMRSGRGEKQKRSLDILSPVYNRAFLIAAAECGISLKIESNDKKIV